MVSCETLSALRSFGAFGRSSAVLQLTTLLCIPRPEVEMVITSARGTVIAAEVAVKNMYHEERELLPAADGTHGKEGLLPGAGGMSSPLEPGSSLFYWRR